ncbi:unnamed protein product [Angiostrongylus costaricensis]|uniref:ANK_REP_REGION domain-containing protein n=1 Tax=Angiostrongylus costaricensis TaxID=334426 RepID=A0A0R3PCE8_ANGCS|nr:unnamed protein product [Angiostrongylus costaricensis]
MKTPSFPFADGKRRSIKGSTDHVRVDDLPWLVGRIQGAEISEQMYNDLDSAIDYGCIFTSGCPRECTACSLCHNSKLRVMKVLVGADPNLDAECHQLIDCAKACLAKGASNMPNVGRCLRHRCAYHCFNGSCPKCSAFITKVSFSSFNISVFNQICVSGELRDRVKGFKRQWLNNVMLHAIKTIVSYSFVSEGAEDGRGMAGLLKA